MFQLNILILLCKVKFKEYTKVNTLHEAMPARKSKATRINELALYKIIFLIISVLWINTLLFKVYIDYFDSKYNAYFTKKLKSFKT